MRILFVTPSYFPIVGGSEVLTRMLSTKMNEIGIANDIMTLNMERKWQTHWRDVTGQDGQTTLIKESALSLPHGFLNPLPSFLQINVIPNLTFANKLKNYDVIHFVGEADLSFPLLSYFVNRPKLLQFLGIFRKGGFYKYYTHDRVFLGKMLGRLFAKIADSFIVSSEEERRLLEELGFAPDRIVILPIGVDTQIFQPDDRKKVQDLILFVGRLERIKGLDILIRALAFVNTPVQLAVVGGVWDSQYIKEVEEMADAVNRKGFHRVRFLDEMKQKQLVSWYQRASLLVCPYLYETYSNVVREAMACGTPVLSTGSHIMDDGSDGILIVNREPENIGKAINDILLNHDIRSKCGQAGRRTIEQYFSWNAIAKDLVATYKALLAE